MLDEEAIWANENLLLTWIISWYENEWSSKYTYKRNITPYNANLGEFGNKYKTTRHNANLSEVFWIWQKTELHFPLNETAHYSLSLFPSPAHLSTSFPSWVYQLKFTRAGLLNAAKSELQLQLHLQPTLCVRLHINSSRWLITVSFSYESAVLKFPLNKPNGLQTSPYR